jgi:hypothetical protein
MKQRKVVSMIEIFVVCKVLEASAIGGNYDAI